MTGGWGEVAGLLGRRDHHRGRAVGLEAAVVAAERLGDPGGGEVVVHGEAPAGHDGPLVEVGVLAAGEGHRPGVGVLDPVLELVAGRDPPVELGRALHAVGEEEVEEHVGERPGVEGAPGEAGPGPGPEGRVAVPADDHEHVAGHPAGDGQRRGLDGGDRAGPTHVRRDGEGEVRDTQVGGELLAPRVAGRRDDAVDVGRGEPGVGDGGRRGLEHQLDGQVGRGPAEVGLGDPRDGGASPEAHGGGSYRPAVGHLRVEHARV
ncbi:MAG: hypothetical protein M5U14_00095 [Acidimicrobiia bacterium]|nr:hypothetical protein [Acidimicrobiia bacterium]